MGLRINGEHGIPSNNTRNVQNSNSVQEEIKVFPTPQEQPAQSASSPDEDTPSTAPSTSSPDEGNSRTETSAKQQQELNNILYTKEQARIKELEAKAVKELKSKDTRLEAESIKTTNQITEIEIGRLEFERLTPSQQRMVLIIKSQLAGESNNEEAALTKAEEEACDKALQYLEQVPENMRDQITDKLVAFSVKQATGDYKRDYSNNSIRKIIIEKVRLKSTGDNLLLNATMSDTYSFRREAPDEYWQERRKEHREELRRVSIYTTGFDPATGRHVNKK